MCVRVALAGALAAVLSGSLPASVLSSDRWENGTYTDDDGNTTFNVLRHGMRQTNHDLEGVSDEDWYRIKVSSNHSYEVRASSGTALWETTVGVDTQLDRVDSQGVVLTAGDPGDDDPDGLGQYATGNTVRWIATADATEFIRVVGSPLETAADNYDIEMFDTTLSVPRWNNSATQITVFVIRNAGSPAVAGVIYFYDPSGGLLYSYPFTIPGNGILNFNTSTIGALVGAGGSAAVANLGGYGRLVGKAVAVEPATGFTFDTAILPFPR